MLASYEKQFESIVTRVRHVVRARFNSDAKSLKKSLSNVPDDAILTMVVDDEEGVGELYFDQEKIKD